MHLAVTRGLLASLPHMVLAAIDVFCLPREGFTPRVSSGRVGPVMAKKLMCEDSTERLSHAPEKTPSQRAREVVRRPSATHATAHDCENGDRKSCLGLVNVPRRFGSRTDATKPTSGIFLRGASLFRVGVERRYVRSS